MGLAVDAVGLVVLAVGHVSLRYVFLVVMCGMHFLCVITSGGLLS